MQTAQRKSLRLLQWMMAASLALPLALFVFASSVSWVSIRETADREIERSLDVANEHALKVFETIDRSLSEIAEITRDLPEGDLVAREGALHLRLKQLVSALPQVKSAWVFDAKGRALVNSLVVPAPDISFADRDYFRPLVAEDPGTHIGEVLTPRPPYQGAPFFGVSRRRPSSDGSFTGVIQVSVLPEYFDNYYARIGREPGSFFAIGRADGALLARFPTVDTAIGIDRDSAIGRLIAAQPKTGLITEKSPIDGIERRLGYQRLAEYPLYVSAGLETSAIRARWLATVSQHLIFGAPATALLFALLGLALRRTRRLYFEAEKRREAEEALKHGQRLEALGQLTGGVAHDFNNLLTVIRASVDLLRRPDLPEARRLRYIDAISDTVTRAAKLTAQLLAFARRQALKPEVFDVARSVQALTEMIGTLIGSRIEIVVLGPEEPCFVNADIGQFETAVINMAVNARDAMEGRGRLTIAVGMAAGLPTAAPTPQLPYGYVAVSVADTGGGIAPDQFDRIFEPFFTTKQAGQGTGLGLSQVFGFAKQSGGEVTVASEVGKGSTFTLFLPRAADGAKARPSPTTGSAAIAGGGMTVLVVEDNAELGEFTNDALIQLGYTTKLVNNATHALEELSTDATRFNVVFTDVVMPGMSGLELAQEIRRTFPELPVVLTSGYSHVLSEHGSHGFELLQKPYTIEQLSHVLHRLGRRQLRRAATTA